MPFFRVSIDAYEEMVSRHSSEYAQVDHRNVTSDVVAEFYRPVREGRDHRVLASWAPEDAVCW